MIILSQCDPLHGYTIMAAPAFVAFRETPEAANPVPPYKAKRYTFKFTTGRIPTVLSPHCQTMSLHTNIRIKLGTECIYSLP